MARIDLTPMQSQYVDPGYTKVAQVLRERYDMSYKDLLGALGYTHNPNSEGRTTMKSPQRAVLKSKYLLYNLMTENVFPKTTLD